MNLKKNDIVQITIEDMGHNGEGIGKIGGYPLFIKDAVIGDEISAIVTKAGKSYGYGRVKDILKSSPHRVEPLCPHAGPCGGCQIQTLEYPRQLEYKENTIRNHLKRIGGFENPPMEPIIGMDQPFYYRNKAQFPVGKDRDGRIITGFYAGRTHRIIDNRRCYLGLPVNEDILNRVISYMEECGVEPYDEETGTGIVRHVLIRSGFSSGEVMVCLVVNAKSLPSGEKLVERLRTIPGMASITISINRTKTNVIMGEDIRLLWGKTYITDSIGDIQYRISPLSFYQVNPVQTRKLYELALEYAGLTGNETVWDLYCGIGTISLFLARNAGRVCGVEIIPQAIEDAKQNAALNGIENAEFFVGKAEEVLPQKYRDEQIKADVIVVDPPRKGCDEKLLETMVQMQPERIVYVSCDSATLARDLKYLCGNGYELVRVRGVDQFCQTVHVETVSLLVKKA
ncbi:23S rRNA (uracil(1939)-C(5))-methyltransferase RlmD [Ruminococcus sp. OA3]|uniref:23S rRNA (uracil(1939)-C(5))-methyltransferase RlmD n=1 Tax=Ruminococcus sp. OA3 TaxID=2914164 RepID=UPI001F05189D|nr:23S rRNA (uracil(1939)-C(5))-methyltransferase RlmD [Ruminococcus sp. OA3]MCH1984377.1 23S rRNA (uracil(1939)-C(5))-methyltransferase RlmD [Ruminococcus sp. OA3]